MYIKDTDYLSMLLRQLLKLNVNLDRIQVKKIPFKSGLNALALKEKSLVGFFLETRTFQQRLKMVHFLKKSFTQKRISKEKLFSFSFCLRDHEFQCLEKFV